MRVDLVHLTDTHVLAVCVRLDMRTAWLLACVVVAARWTASDDALLRGLYNGGATMNAIGDALGRSASAVSERRRTLGIATRSRIVPWTQAEDALLRAAHAAGVPASALAPRLGRTVEQVRRRQRQPFTASRTPAAAYSRVDDERNRVGWELGADVEALARQLGRSAASVRLRAQTLDLYVPPARPRWLPHEDAVVREGYEQALSCAQIAAQLSGRTPRAVAARAAKLGVATYGRAWSALDDRRLRLLAGEQLALEAIAQVLGRTPQAVLMRARRLQIALPRALAAPRAGLRWTSEEDELLRMHAALNPAVLAGLLHRSASSITQRLRRLGLRDGRSPRHPASRRGTLTPGERVTAARELAAGGPARVFAVARRLDVSPALVRAAASEVGSPVLGRPPLSTQSASFMAPTPSAACSDAVVSLGGQRRTAAARSSDKSDR